MGASCSFRQLMKNRVDGTFTLVAKWSQPLSDVIFVSSTGFTQCLKF